MLGRPVTLALRARLPRCILEQTSTADFTAARIIISRTVRHYATPGRPRTAVGEPSKPVKRAVKRTAVKPATATEKGESREKATKTAKSTTPKTKKAAPRKKVTKALTPEQQQRKDEKTKINADKLQAKEKRIHARTAARKEAAKARGKVQAEKDKIVQLKKAALQPPDVYGGTTFIAYCNNRVKEYFSDASNNVPNQPATPMTKEFSREIAEDWKNLAPADIEHWNHVTRVRREEDQAKYVKWVESHTPGEIRAANSARRSLNRRFPTSHGCHPSWPLIRDERKTKQTNSPYIIFATSRQRSGDFANIGAIDRFRLIAQEWRSLDAEERKKYDELSQQDRQRYVTEYTSVNNFPPPPYVHDVSQAGAAASAVAAAA